VAGRIDEASISGILEMPKHIEDDITWTHKQKDWLEFRTRIECDADCTLWLVGSYNHCLDAYSYSFLANGQRLRGLDVGKDHHNPTCEDVGSPHVNYWTDPHEAKMAREADDIDCSTMASAIEGFLKLCKIDLNGIFHAPTVQERLL